MSSKRPLSAGQTAIVYWHRASVSFRSFRWWLGNAVFVAFWVLFALPIYKANIKLGIVHTLFAVALLGARARRWASPKNMQFVQAQYLERKLRFYALIKEMQYRAMMSADDIARFQRGALELIASYVRGHRADMRGTEIFANLLVEDGHDLVVVARNQDHRLPGARYSKKSMVAYRAISSGEAAYTGDVIRENTAASAGKKYASILALPIHGEGRVLGAVSIDSTRRHHFDIEWSDLERYLAPYVCLLGWTLAMGSGRVHQLPQKGGAS